MFITLPEFASADKSKNPDRAVQTGHLIELSNRMPYFHATFEMKEGNHREFLVDCWRTVERLRRRRTVVRLVELHYVTPPAQANGLRSIHKLVSVFQSTLDDSPTNDVVFVFRTSSGLELIEGEWIPNQFLGVQPDRVPVLTL